jgi:hypothetical protein
MKHFTLSLILLSVLFISDSCKKNQEELTCGERLEGTWRATSILFDGTEYWGPAKAYQKLEFEFSNFNVVDAEGRATVVATGTGLVNGGISLTGFYKPTNSCSRVELPDAWWCYTVGSNTTYSFTIVDVNDETLSLRTNYIGGPTGSVCDGDVRVDLIKIK